MTVDYHRIPTIQFRPDAELHAAIEAHQRPGESINQTAKRLVQQAAALQAMIDQANRSIERGSNARLAHPPQSAPVPVGHERNTRRADSG